MMFPLEELAGCVRLWFVLLLYVTVMRLSARSESILWSNRQKELIGVNLVILSSFLQQAAMLSRKEGNWASLTSLHGNTYPNAVDARPRIRGQIPLERPKKRHSLSTFWNQ
jgi:hypothetical protein